MMKRFLPLAFLLMPGTLLAQKQLNVSLSKTEKVYHELQKSLKDVQIFNLKSFQTPTGNENEILITLGNEQLIFNGNFNTQLTADMKLKVDGNSQTPENLPVLFNGSGRDEGRLRMGLNRNFVLGSFEKNGNRYMMEMARNMIENAGRDEVIVYRAADVITTADHFCGVKDEAVPAQRAAETNTASAVASCYLMEITLVIDNESFKRHSNSIVETTSFFLSMYNLSEAQFTTGLVTPVNFRMKEMLLYTTPESNPMPVENELMNMYTNFMGLASTGLFDQTADIASYWTSATGGGTVGWSYLGMMCPGVNIYRETGMVAEKMRNLISHELGHLFGCNHTDGYIMNPMVTADLNWAPESISVLNNRLNSGLACLGSCNTTTCEENLTAGVRVVRSGANYVVNWTAGTNPVKVEVQTSGPYADLGTYPAGTTTANVPVPTTCDSTVTRIRISTICPNSNKSVSTVVNMVSGMITPKLNYTGTVDFCAVDGVVLSASPESSTLTYQWFFNGNAISGATQATYSATAAGNYYCKVSNGSCANVSNTVQLQATGNITASIEASDLNICPGTSVSFKATTNANNASYQWKLNGVNVGTNSAEYSSFLLNTGDAVSCVITGRNGCIGKTATSNSLRITVSRTPALTAVISSPGGTQVCASGQIYLTGVVNNISNVTYQWYRNGSPVGINSPTLTYPALTGGSYYLKVTQETGCNGTISVNSNTLVITTLSGPAVTGSVSISPATAACSSTPRTFTAITNIVGGTYQWELNGNSIYGATGATYTASGFNEGDVMRVVINAPPVSPCYSSYGIVTANVPILVSNSVRIAPVVTISTNDAAVCGSALRTFTSSVNVTGVTFQWQRNGANIAGATAATYSSTALVAGDVIKLNIMVPSSGCYSSTTASSNTISLTSAGTIIPTASTTVSPATGCAGVVRTFTATTNITGGAYQWQKNGININGATGATYSASGFNNGDNVRVIITATSGGCYTTNSVTSANTTVGVSVALAPTVTVITQTPADCSSTSRTFTATTNITGGAYQWKKNGVNVSGANAATYTASGFIAGDVVNVVVSAPANSCYTSSAITSSNVTVSSARVTTPTVSISASPLSGCSNITRTFSSSTNITGGTYQWMKNGLNITGATSPTYSASGFVDGDDIKLKVTVPSGSCYTTSSITSSSLILAVTNSVSPVANVVVTPLAACAGTPRTFSVSSNATPSSYQWMKNGVTIYGQTGATVSLSNLLTTDAISVRLGFAAGSCVTFSSYTTPSVRIQNTSAVVPTATVAVNAQSGCVSTVRTFTATTNVSGASYQWKKNEINISGATSATYTALGFNDLDQVKVVVTVPNTGCFTVTSVTSTAVVLRNTAVTPTASISVNTQSACASTVRTFTSVTNISGATYQWLKNGANISGATSATYSSSAFVNNDRISLRVTAPSTGCYTSNQVTTNIVTLSVTAANTPTVTLAVNPQSGCANTGRTFTATGNISGATFSWYKNNVLISGASGSSYTASNFSNNDQVRVVATLPATSCYTLTTVQSQLNVAVMAPVFPTALITVSSTSGSANTRRSFYSSTNVVGATYQWYRNNVAISGATSSTYSTTSYNNNDLFYVRITVPASGCYSASFANSNSIKLTIASRRYSISRVSSEICEGDMQTFRVDGNTSGLSFKWRKNDVVIPGANASTYSSDELEDGDILSCSVEQTGARPVLTNELVIEVIDNVTPQVTLNNSPATITAGSSVQFVASATNAGNAAEYKWYVNDQLKQTGGNTFTPVLTEDSYIHVILQSSLNCVTKKKDTSLKKKLKVRKIRGNGNGNGNDRSDVDLATSKKSATAYPNPATDHVVISDIAEGFTKAILTDRSGMVVARFDVMAGKDLRIIRSQSMISGLYFLTLIDPDGNKEGLKILFR